MGFEKAITTMTPLRGVAKQKVRPTTKLWALAERAAKITGTQPGRWLKAGEWALEHAIITYDELKPRGEMKNPAAYFTFLVKKYRE
jgi:hypothetical protein